jgi:hypothetical protein
MKKITYRHFGKQSVPAEPIPGEPVLEPSHSLVLDLIRLTLVIFITMISIVGSNFSWAQSKPEKRVYNQGNIRGTTTTNNSLVHLDLNATHSNAEVNATGPLIWGKALWRHLGGEALQGAEGLTRISFKLPVQRFTLSGMPNEQIGIITELVRNVPAATMELNSTQIRHLKFQNYLINGTASFQGKTENFSIPVIIRRLSTNRFTVEGKINASDVFSKSNNFMFASMQGLAKVSLLYDKST